jgi:hypothetical protein
MKKLIIFSFICLFAYNPEKITSNDLEVLKQFDKKAYNITTQQNKINFNLYYKVLRCIKNTYSWKDRIKIYTKAEAEANGQKAAILGVEYNIFDNKEKRTITEQYKTKKNNAIDFVKNYLLNLEKLENFKQQLKYFNLLEIRLKAREKTGIIDLDTRLKNLQNIQTIQMNIINTKIIIENLKNKINNICNGAIQ